MRGDALRTHGAAREAPAHKTTAVGRSSWTRRVSLRSYQRIAGFTMARAQLKTSGSGELGLQARTSLPIIASSGSQEGPFGARQSSEPNVTVNGAIDFCYFRFLELL